MVPGMPSRCHSKMLLVHYFQKTPLKANAAKLACFAKLSEPTGNFVLAARSPPSTGWVSALG